MSAPDPITALCEWPWPLPAWTPEAMDAAAAQHEQDLADEYQREQIASANSAMPDDDSGDL